MTFILDWVYLSLLLLFGCYLSKSKVLKNQKLLTLILLELVIFAFNLVAIFTVYVLKFENNLFLFHILAPIQFYLTAKLIQYYLNQTKLILILRKITPFVIVLNIYSSLFLQKLTEYNSYTLILNNLIIGFFSIFILWETILEYTKIGAFAKYWLAIGLFTNSFFAFFIQGFMNIFIAKEINLAFKLYLFEMIVYIISTVLLHKAFYSEYKLLKYSHGNQ